MFQRFSISLAPILIAWGCCQAPLIAAPVAVVNASFELDVLPDGGVSHSATGWQATSGGGDGTYNPTVFDFPSGAPDGQNVGYVNQPGNYLFQTLSSNLAANTRYTLTVAVGRRTGHSFVGYKVQLLACGNVLAEDDSSISLEEATFATTTVTFKTDSDDSCLGDPLSIQLRSLGSQTNFDDVRLDASPCCVGPPYGMTAWWPLDEPGPATSADIMSANDGAHVGGPTPIAGMVDGALNFDGASDYVEAPDDPSLDVGTGDFSLDAWIRSTDASGVATMLDKRTTGGGVRGYSLYLYNGDLGFQLADAAGSSQTCSSDPTTSSCTNWVAAAAVADGDWHHIAVTVNRDDLSGLVFYVDGAQVGTFDPTIRQGSLDNASPLRLGAQSFNTSLRYAGDLDEVELFKRVLGPAEVLALYQAGADGKCKDRISMDWDVPVCLGADYSRPTSIEVCNDGTEDRDYEMSFLPVPQGACGIDGPDAFRLLGPPPQNVPPAVALSVAGRSCVNVPFEIMRPLQMTSGGLVGCFDAVLTNLDTGGELRRRSSVQDWRECCSTGPTTGVTDLPPGQASLVRFSLINTNGAPLSFDYRIETMPPEGQPASLLSLDGQPAGTPVSGSVTFDDGEVVDLDVEVEFGGEVGLVTEDLLLFVDTGGGSFQVLASSRVRARLANEVFADGFESGDLSRWSSSAPLVP